MAQGGNNSSISGYAYLDINADGMRQTGEPALPGVNVKIVPASGAHVSRVTRADGYYSLTRMTAGEAYVVPELSHRYQLNVTKGSGVIPVNLDGVARKRCDLPYVLRCASVQVKQVRWDPRTPGKAVVRFCITNHSPFEWGWIEMVNLPAGVAATPNPKQLVPIVNPNKTRNNIDVTFTGVTPNTELKFMMNFHSPDKSFCCGMRVCVTLPPCECFQETFCNVECFPNRKYRYTFQYQNLDPNKISRVVFRPDTPSNLTFTPSIVSYSPTVARGGVLNGTTDIQMPNGDIGGMTICFFVDLLTPTDNGHRVVCTKRICLKMPNCNECDFCPCIPTRGAPDFSEFGVWNAYWAGQKSYAAGTCMSFADNNNGSVGGNDDYVLAVFGLKDYQNQALASGAGLGNDSDPEEERNWNPEFSVPSMPGYHNEPTVGLRWTRAHMGQIFGLCIDKRGDVYVAQTSSYNGDGGRTPALHGVVWRIDGSGAHNGDMKQFNVPLPQSVDPGIVDRNKSNDPEDQLGLSQGIPELGDVCYDEDHDQIFVTNMEDGKIYRYAAGPGAPKTPLDANGYDPMGPDNGAAGFAPRGELLWAVRYHCGRLYYSVWVEDLEFIDKDRANYVRSVAINPNGSFAPLTDRFECEAPRLNVWFGHAGVGQPSDLNLGTSSPISDISFSPEGYMMIAEKSMGWIAGYNDTYVYSARANSTTPGSGARALTNQFAHNARGLLYQCVNGKWDWTRDSSGGDVLYAVGGNSALSSWIRSCAGGTDWDYDNHASVSGVKGRRVWFTEELGLYQGPYGNNAAYGIQGIRINGGGSSTSLFVDFNGNVNSGVLDKNTPGDVEFFMTTGGPTPGGARP